ncbi:MAG: hypothetical protein AAFR38_03075 [Planctomycetota bacterium]
MRRWLLLVLALGACVICFGCASRPAGPAAIPAAEVPSYETIAAAWNARVENVEPLWARSTVVFEGRDAEGSDFSQLVEGHLQVIRPDRLALSLDKLGDTYVYIGTDESSYWWFDLVDRDNRLGFIGRHESFDGDIARELGLPVEPRDLIALLAIRPIAETMPEDVVVRWSVPEGFDRALIEVVEPRATPSGPGQRRIYLDPDWYRPLRIVLVGPDGGTVSADLERYLDYERAGINHLAVPGRLIITGSSFDGLIRIGLYEPQRREINPLVFDVRRLAQRFRVGELIDLDDPGVRRRLREARAELD